MAEETDDRDRPDAADERPIAGHALLALEADHERERHGRGELEDGRGRVEEGVQRGPPGASAGEASRTTQARANARARRREVMALLLAGRGHTSALGLCERERRAYDAHMFGMGFGELLVVLVIVLVVFGPGRLPEMMSHLGKGLQAFRKGLHEPPEIEKGRESNDPSKTRREP